MAGSIRPFEGVSAVLVTMHGKEKVIFPLLEAEWGVAISLASDVDTDRFGTFSRDVLRTGSQLDAARAKITAGFGAVPAARLGLASEGSYGPHPSIPFLAVGRELVLLVDRETGLELSGHDLSPETNYGHTSARDVEEALVFARRSGFPGHGVIVMGCEGDLPAPHLLLEKDIHGEAELEASVGRAISLCGKAFVETDMRAHRNPTRMKAIARATHDLVRRYSQRCPQCAWPGFDVTERKPGLPCSGCGMPTSLVRTEVLACRACGHHVERHAPPGKMADPGECENCNR